VKRLLLVAAAALLFLNTLVVPTIAHADGGSGGGNCSGSTGLCKPQLTKVLPTLPFGGIVPNDGYAATAFTFVALLVGRTQRAARRSCLPDAKAWTSQGVPGFLLLRHF